MSEFCNEGEPLATWSGQVDYDSASALSTIGLTFSSQNSMNSSGKYIYQLTVKLKNGVVAEVRKGILFVRRNISAET